MKKRLPAFLITVCLTAVAATSLYPFLLMGFGSVKTARELSSNPGGWPIAPTFQNYIDLFLGNSGLIQSGILNTFLITILHVFITVFISALAAYAFAKIDFKGRNILFIALLATMMIPMEVMLPPLYILFSRIGWINTYQVQILPGTANVLALFMLRQFMKTVNDAVLDAAKIDGASHFTIFRQIILPMSSPAVGAITVLLALSKWNDFLWPAMMITRPDRMPLMVVLPLLSTTEGSVFAVPWELLLAGCVVSSIPVLVLFIFFQEKIMTGVSFGAVKE